MTVSWVFAKDSDNRKSCWNGFSEEITSKFAVFDLSSPWGKHPWNTHGKKEEVLSLLRFEFCDSKGIHSKKSFAITSRNGFTSTSFPFFLRYNSDILPRCKRWLHPRAPDQKKLEDCLRELLWSSRLQILFLYDSLAKWNENFSHIFRQIRPHPCRIGWRWVIFWYLIIQLCTEDVNRKYISKLQPMRPQHEPRSNSGKSMFSKGLWSVGSCTGELDPPNHDNRKNND